MEQCPALIAQMEGSIQLPEHTHLVLLDVCGAPKPSLEDWFPHYRTWSSCWRLWALQSCLGK